MTQNRALQMLFDLRFLHSTLSSRLEEGRSSRPPQDPRYESTPDPEYYGSSEPHSRLFPDGNALVASSVLLLFFSSSSLPSNPSVNVSSGSSAQM